MSVIPGMKILPQAQVMGKAKLTAVMRNASDQIGLVLQRYSGPDGTIRKADVSKAQQEAGAVITRTFVGPDGRNAFGDNGVTALAPYPQMLNGIYAWVNKQVVMANHDYLKRQLPPDIYAWLQTAQTRELMTPKQAFAWYDPMHTFVDPNGYDLSDRIWRTSVRTRMQVDALIADGIRNNMSVVNLAKLVEGFLQPGRINIRTSKPYGRDGSFDARRLTRTEITAAWGRVTMLNARLNPFAKDVTWRLSASHPKTDHCDNLAAGSPYPLDGVPRYPDHPHCLCQLIINARPRKEVVDELRDQMHGDGADSSPRPAPVTPVQWYWLLLLLLGGELYSEVA